MLERGLISRIIFPAPPSSYDVDYFPHDLIWVPKTKTDVARLEDSSECPPIEDCVPCLLLTYPSARFLIIFFHSNAEDLGRCHGFCCYIRDQFQVHVLAVEYPGYGICPGTPCGESVMENALAAMNFVTDTLRWPMDSIKVFGRSIGTGPAMGLAAAFSLAGLILVTPFLSVQELFRDRVGPFAGFVEEWFPNVEEAPKITSPTMIIHGQRDELIACRHGESIYELLRPRKLLISPPEMEHNTNLLTNLQFFVLPMFQFFALPDYAFQDLQVPPWAYDKRRSPFYIRPGVEISSHQLPTAAGKKKMLMPSGDDGIVPVAIDSPRRQPEAATVAKLKKASEKTVNGEELSATSGKKAPSRQLAPLFSSQEKQLAKPTQASAADKAVSKKPAVFDGDRAGASAQPLQPPASDTAPARPGFSPRAEPGAERAAGFSPRAEPRAERASGGTGPRGVSKEKVVTPEAKKAIERLESFAGKIRDGDMSSDGMCVLEERIDEKQAQSPQKAAQHVASPQGRPCAGGFTCGSQSIWPTWCGKDRKGADSDVEVEVKLLAGRGAQAPGLPPSDVDADTLQEADDCGDPFAASARSRQGYVCESETKGYEDDLASWEGWPTSPAPSSPSQGCVQAPASSGATLPWKESRRRAEEAGASESTATGTSKDGNTLTGSSSKRRAQGNASANKNPIWSSCCRPLPSDPLLDRAPSTPGSIHAEEHGIAQFGGRVIAGSHRPMLPEDSPRRLRSSGSPVPLLSDEDTVQEVAPDNGFRRGTKFAI